MYIILLGEEKQSTAKLKTFCLWYIWGEPFYIEQWRAGVNVPSFINHKQQNASFTNMLECDKVMGLYGLHLEDFDTPSEFCRKKNYEFFSIFWKDLSNHLYQKRIWIHRSSDLRCSDMKSRM